MELIFELMICVGFWLGVGWGYGFMQSKEEKDSCQPTPKTIVITIIGVLLFISGILGIISIH